MTRLDYEPARPDQRPLIVEWLKQPHVHEWLLGEGYRNTIASLDRFLCGTGTDPSHWIAYGDGKPFAYLISATLCPEDARYAAVNLAGDRPVSIDVFICESTALGKGYGAPLIRGFLERCCPGATDALIDPEASNARALHVYRKAGFRIVDTFIAPWHPVPHFMMHLPLQEKLRPDSGRATCRRPVWRQVEELLSRVETTLTGTIAGVYLHGSLAFGCFNPMTSDIDVLVVTDAAIPVGEKAMIVESLLQLSGSPHPIEISFIRRADVTPWRHPAPFDLHYSEAWRDRCAADLADGSWKRWRSPADTDEDLAAHIAVTHETGLVLHGEPTGIVLPAVPAQDLESSLRADLQWAVERVTDNPVYLVLNACRALAFFSERRILSKRDGARWALGTMPEAFRPAIAHAGRAYEDSSDSRARFALLDEDGQATALRIASYVLASAVRVPDNSASDT